MEIKTATGNIADMPNGAIVVSYFEEQENLDGEIGAVDRALGGNIKQLIAQGEIKGKPGEVTLVHTLGKLPALRVAVLGLGKKEDMTGDKVRRAAAEAARFLRKKGVDNFATVALGAGTGGIDRETSAQLMTEGVLLGTYAFLKHITREPEYREIKQVVIVDADRDSLPALERGCRTGRIIAEATNLARDMVNEPPNFMTPADMANTAEGLARTHSLGIEVLERKQMEELGMGALLAVNQGSDQPPKMIIMRYTGKEGAVDITLVGKGITFDSGGISIKPSEKMDEMKDDMAGGAAVMAAMSAIAQLKPRINVVAIVPATENMPSGHAYKPGDVLKAMNGKTIEVISTDAEGRLILADALSYANRLGARMIVDVATLTGSCRVALGDICSGVFGNNKELVDKLLAAASETGEYMWQMPMYEEYKELNKSDVGDIKNSGGRYAGSITAAQFLSEFSGDTPWVHIDIAGTVRTDKDNGYQIKGATGVPVRTLINLVQALSQK